MSATEEDVNLTMETDQSTEPESNHLSAQEAELPSTERQLSPTSEHAVNLELYPSEPVQIPKDVSNHALPLEAVNGDSDHTPAKNEEHADEHEPAEKDCLLTKTNGSNGTNGTSKKCPNGKTENGDAGMAGGKINGEEKEICVEVEGKAEEGKEDETMSSGGPGVKKACDIRCIIIGLLVVVIMVGGACVAILAHRFKAEAGPELHFASYYSDNMVLQRAPQRAVVWGYGPITTENTSVTVRLEGQGRSLVYNTIIKNTVAGQVWRVVLDEVDVDGPFTLTAELDAEDKEGGGAPRATVSLKSVMFGDVWICAGQDNMQMSTDKISTAAEELSSIDTSLPIRLFSLFPVKSDTPYFNLRGVQLPWSSPTRDSLAGSRVPEGQTSSHFSGLCWLFGKKLHDKLQYPVGLVSMTYNDSPIEDWTPDTHESECGRHIEHSSRVWNAMVHPMLDMSIFGLIWSHGERNALLEGGRNYNCSLVELVNQWREETFRRTLGSTDRQFPVGVVQLAPHRDNDQLTYGYPDIRWRQTANYGFLPNAQLKKSFLAVTMDLPDINSTHGSMLSGHKEDIADRLVLGALAVAYRQKDVGHQGPFPSRYTASDKDHSLTLYFNDSTIDVRSRNGFEVCCSDNRSLLCQSSFIKVSYAPGREWVEAPLLNHTLHSVTLSSAACNSTSSRQHVVGLRYAWRETPCVMRSCAVYGSETGLPMPPYIRLGLVDDGLTHVISHDQVNLI